MVRNIGRGLPCRWWNSGVQGTLNRGNNAEKRMARAEAAQLRGSPGGWKKALRVWRESGVRPA